MNISISRDGVEIGEWTEEMVRKLYRDGTLFDTDYYWMPGMPEWDELSRLMHIKPVPPRSVAVPPAAKLETRKKTAYRWIWIAVVATVIIWGFFAVMMGGSIYYSIPEFLGDLTALAIPILLAILLRKQFPKLAIVWCVLGSILIITALSLIFVIGFGNQIKSAPYQTISGAKQDQVTVPLVHPTPATPTSNALPPSWATVEASDEYKNSTSPIRAQVFKRWMAAGQVYIDSLKGANPQDDQKAQQQFNSHVADIGAKNFGLGFQKDENGKLITIAQEAALRGVSPESLYQNQYDTPDLPYTIPLKP